MQTVNVILKNNPNQLTFVFKYHKAGEDLYKKILACTSEKVDCEDDFDLKATLCISDIAAVTFSDFEKDMDKNNELQLIQHKSQMKAQKKAQSDIGLQILNAPGNSHELKQ